MAVGDVEWRRSRHSITTPDHAVALDIHRLDRRRAGGSWSVMIVVRIVVGRTPASGPFPGVGEPPVRGPQRDQQVDRSTGGSVAGDAQR